MLNVPPVARARRSSGFVSSTLSGSSLPPARPNAWTTAWDDAAASATFSSADALDAGMPAEKITTTLRPGVDRMAVRTDCRLGSRPDGAAGFVTGLGRGRRLGRRPLGDGHALRVAGHPGGVDGAGGLALGRRVGIRASAGGRCPPDDLPEGGSHLGSLGGERRQRVARNGHAQDADAVVEAEPVDQRGGRLRRGALGARLDRQLVDDHEQAASRLGGERERVGAAGLAPRGLEDGAGPAAHVADPEHAPGLPSTVTVKLSDPSPSTTCRRDRRPRRRRGWPPAAPHRVRLSAGPRARRRPQATDERSRTIRAWQEHSRRHRRFRVSSGSTWPTITRRTGTGPRRRRTKEQRMLNRRQFVHGATVAGVAAALPDASAAQPPAQGGAPPGPLPASFAALPNLRAQARPITNDERLARIERAKALMAKEGLGAIVLTGGTSLVYFSNLRWGQSERMLAVILPAKGDPVIVCPAFELGRADEQLEDRTAGGAEPGDDLAGGREPVRPGGPGAQVARRRDGARGHRGNGEVRVRRQHRPGGPGRAVCQRDAGHRRLPDGQGRARDRVDAPRVEGDAERLRGRVPGAARRDDAGRVRRADVGGGTSGRDSAAAAALRSARTRRTRTARRSRR